jgi:hypothetical protein
VIGVHASEKSKEEDIVSTAVRLAKDLYMQNLTDDPAHFYLIHTLYGLHLLYKNFRVLSVSTDLHCLTPTKDYAVRDLCNWNRLCYRHNLDLILYLGARFTRPKSYLPAHSIC